MRKFNKKNSITYLYGEIKRLKGEITLLRKINIDYKKRLGYQLSRKQKELEGEKP